MSNESYEQQLAELKLEYVDLLPKQLKDITAAWEHLQHVNWDKSKLEKLKLASHSLVGSGASYGFSNISTAAKLLEQQLLKVDSHSQAGSKERKQINNFIAQLASEIEKAGVIPILIPDVVPSSSPSVNTTKTKPASIAVVEDDKAQANLLKLNLQQLGYNVSVFNSPDSFAKDYSRTDFDLIILDVSFPEGPLEGLFWLEHIHNQLRTHCPIIITSARSDFVARMRAVRAGASAYIAKPLNIEEVHKQITNCLTAQKTAGTRVLWVDDDAQLLALYKRLLIKEGFEFEGITQPLKIIESLEAFQPDIIIMDYQMPGCNGAELATMLKQDVRFMTIPIIFASGSNTAIEQKEKLSILGNSFLKKPFETSELLSNIRTQLSKAKYVSGKIEQVSQRLDKNGLQTKRFFLEKLETLLFQNSFASEHENTFLVYATIDNIDYLRERFGLRNLANLTLQLENHLSGDNLIQGNGCTIGNASYLILITLDKSEKEKEVLYKFQQSISQHEWSIENKTCKLTLTLGVTALQNNNNLDDIIENVEQAAFDGISSGGNRVEWVKSVEQNQEILNDAIKARMKEQSFKLFFQPIVNLETDETIFEALIRLDGKDGQTFAPNQFMPWIDSTLEGGTSTLDRWLIGQAITEINKLSDEDGKPASIIIKLASSLSQIVGLLSEIRFSYQQNKQKTSGKLIFALPISVIMKDVEKAKQIIENLKELGCGFMIEKVEPQEAHLKLFNDIGMIDYVKMLPTQIVSKAVDKFVTLVHKDKKTAPTLVISGIEDSLMLAHYWELGIRNFQGYFIQKPGKDMVLKE